MSHNDTIIWHQNGYEVLYQGSLAPYQREWYTDKTSCWRPAPDLNTTWIAGVSSNATPPVPSIELFPKLERCCPWQNETNIYTLRAGCRSVVCYTNSTVLVRDWKNCTDAFFPDLLPWASKIDYDGLLDSMNLVKASAAGKVRALVSVAIVASLITSVAVSGL